jgi:hypothetical protein
MSAMTPSQQTQDLFRPLVGQLVWNVRRGHGSFVTLEFGQPHISVREPITPSPDSSARVQHDLKRRRVFIAGDWHLFLQYCDWKISVSGGSLDSQCTSSSPDECLLDLDGQRLVSVESGFLPHSWKFRFDLGGILDVWPSAQNESSADLWSLHEWDGDITAMCGDGTIMREKATQATPAGNN